MKHRAWIIFSGVIWLLIGTMLLQKGLRLMAASLTEPTSLSFRLQGLCGSIQQAATALLGIALLIGFLKGRFVLSKTVRRVVSRILSLSLPIRIQAVYAPSYWILIGSMLLLGLIFRFLPIALDLRGMIDVAIGAALIQGAILYFRAARITYDTDFPAQSR